MKPKKHIKKFYDHIHKMIEDGHIDKPDKYTAISDLEISIHQLRKTFEYTGEIENEPDRDT